MGTRTVLTCDLCGDDAVERLTIKGAILGTNLRLDLCQKDLAAFEESFQSNTCNDCGRMFPTQQGLKAHKTRAHGVHTVPKELKKNRKKTTQKKRG